MIASFKRGTIYVGVTGDLPSRMEDHERGEGSKFAKQYGLKRLVWFEWHDTMAEAIQREKSLKRYYRQWKINLIEEHNPEWRNLHPETGEFIPNAQDHGSSPQGRG